MVCTEQIKDLAPYHYPTREEQRPGLVERLDIAVRRGIVSKAYKRRAMKAYDAGTFNGEFAAYEMNDAGKMMVYIFPMK